jgi:hypothetical protein
MFKVGYVLICCPSSSLDDDVSGLEGSLIVISDYLGFAVIGFFSFNLAFPVNFL